MSTAVVSIHAPRGGRDHYATNHTLGYVVSIHAPRGGRDCTARRSAARC